MRPAVRVFSAASIALALATLAGGCGAKPSGSSAGSRKTVTSPSPAAGARAVAARVACTAGTHVAAAFPSGLGSPHQLRAIQFVSARAGWVAGRDRILHTFDGGAHWQVQYRVSPRAALTGLDFVDSAHGWVTGPTTLLTTSDGGTHWQRLPVPCAPLRSVHFISPLTGYAVAGTVRRHGDVPPVGGIVLKTTDGGRTWSRLPTPAAAQSVCFTSASHGWLGADGSIYGTADGGVTWRLALGDPYRTAGNYYPGDAIVQCAGPTAAWALIIGPGAGMSHQPYVALHSDGGAWSAVFDELYMAAPGIHTKVEAPGPDAGPFSAVTAGQAMFAGYCAPCSPPGPTSARLAQGGTASLGLASGGGVRFGPLHAIAGISSASGMAFLTPRDGWVVGDLDLYPTSGKGKVPAPVSRILHTTDGGLTWQVQYSI